MSRWSGLLVGCLRVAGFLAVVLAALASKHGCFGNFPVGLDDVEVFPFDDLLAGDEVAAIAATEFHRRFHTCSG